MKNVIVLLFALLTILNIPSVSAQPTDLCSGGTPFIAEPYGSIGSPYDAFDNSLSYIWQSNYTRRGGGTINYIGYDFGDLNRKIVTSLAIAPYWDGGYRIKGFKVQASNDMTNWDTLYSGNIDCSLPASITAPNGYYVGEFQYFTFSNATAFRAYRILQDGVGCVPDMYFAVAEIEMYGTIGDSGCTYDISPASQNISALGGSNSINVVASSSSCTWTAISNAPWITISSGSSGTGNDIVDFAVSENESESIRYGTITVAGKISTVTQDVNKGNSFMAGSLLSESSSAAFDHDLSYIWQSDYTRNGGGTINYIGYDFGDAHKRIFNRVAIAPYADGGYRIKGFKVQASNDMENWNTLYNGSIDCSQPAPIKASNAPYYVGDFQYFKFCNTSAYRAYRILQDGEGCFPDMYFAIGEIEMSAVAIESPVNLCSGGTPFIAEQIGAIGSPFDAFDNDSSHVWHSNYTRNGGAINYIGYDFGDPNQKVITSVAIAPYWDGGYRIKGFKIQASNDMENWNTLYNGSIDCSQPANIKASNGFYVGEFQSFTYNNNTAYRAYRILQDGVGCFPDMYFAIAEIEMYGVDLCAVISCTYGLSPTTQTFSSIGGTASLNITAAAPACTWIATSNAPWISMTSGNSGSGNNTVTFTIAENTSTDSRTGTITIEGQIFTVSQSGVPQYALTTSKIGTGGGTVIGSPIGISCGSDCSESYAAGTIVTLSASPDSGSVFTGWSGGSCSGTGPCTLTMNTDLTITAIFDFKYPLEVTASGTGTGTVSGAGMYDYGSIATVTAAADTGSTFTGWSGDCSGIASPTTVFIDRHKTCTATFVLTFQLSVMKTGTGGGIVSPLPVATDWTGSNGTYNYDTVVTLTATPLIGSVFVGWSGEGCSGTGTCMVTMNADRNVTASFIPTYLLTVQKNGAGSGTVTSFPPGIDYGFDFSETYLEGTTVTLTASPEPSSLFVGWLSGDCSGTGTCQLTMDAEKSVIAVFDIRTYDIYASVLGSGGSVSLSSPQVSYGGTFNLTISPDTGHHLLSLTDNGADVTASVSGNTYTLTNVIANHNLVAVFDRDTFNVTPESGSNGNISPSTPQSVKYQDTVQFTVTLDSGYTISAVTGCNGTLSGNTYTTGQITADCMVNATFQPAPPDQIARDVQDIITALPPIAFKNPNNQNTLLNKLDAVISLINDEEYQNALNKLQNDILSKTNGCALNDNADANDWITECAYQKPVYDVVQLLIQQLQILL